MVKSVNTRDLNSLGQTALSVRVRLGAHRKSKDMNKPEIINKFRDEFDDCMDYLDTEKICKMMNAVDWKWAHEETIDSAGIRRLCRNLFKQVMERVPNELKDWDYSISTGGMKLSFSLYYQEMEWHHGVNVEFVGESSSNW